MTAVGDVDAGEAKLSAQKAWMDQAWVAVMHSEEFPGYRLPDFPFDERAVFFAWQEARFIGDVEVALGRYKAGVRIEKTQGDLPRCPSAYVCRRIITSATIRTPAGCCGKRLDLCCSCLDASTSTPDA